ncbi:CorA family divalent cation transporter [Pleionea litopenaei]|uniref:CorA family divalent cation transporter n=1 Tax=Pleionea litopenaei TaxID=3070815 RepID=A0AA51X595_9GAMM|nr:CorA family divalent cation transporter [Pleionea sp. HL-JVS1]WMS85762.1 CorA family divalent cation transporter [Pleionea sp. HL-JVS1]
MSAGESFYFTRDSQWISSEFSQFDAEQKTLWAVVNYRDKILADRIIDTLSLSETHGATLTDPDVRPRLWITKNEQLLLFIRGINLNPNSEPQDMVSLRIYFDGQKLICFRNRKLQAISELRQSLSIDTTLDVEELFAKLLNEIVLRIESQIIQLANQLDDIEEKAEQDQAINFHKVEDIRKVAARLWRYISPQQDVFKKLSQISCSWASDDLKEQLFEIEDNITYQAEELALLRERCQMLETREDNQLTQKVNRNLYLISIITAVFLPISFLTGLLGINIGGMPGVESDRAFWTFCSILLVIAVIEIIYLKRKKWF